MAIHDAPHPDPELAFSLLGRCTHALAEYLALVGTSDTWISDCARGMLQHIAAEVLVLQQHSRRTLSANDVARFLCEGIQVDE